MDLSRRGVLGGLGAACAVGAVGFAGAVSVTDEASTDAGDGGADAAANTTDDGSTDDETTTVAVDPDAPFEARLLRAADGDASGDDGGAADGDGYRLFDATELDRVKGIDATDGEHLVYVALSEAGRTAVRERLADAGATDEPEPFVALMTLDGEEVRRVDLDAETVTALSDEEWSGVVTLPFESAGVAESVYEALAA
jgi:hypothetical protein